jgi:hypothetical protein
MKAVNFLLLLLVFIGTFIVSCSHCDDEDNNRDQLEKKIVNIDTLSIEELQ